MDIIFQGRVDLHMHSSASDGLLSPALLMKTAAQAGLAAAGLTDHDTIGGLDEAAGAAERYSLELVPGVEISIVREDREIHILGYYPQQVEQLARELEQLRLERRRRMALMLERLDTLGFNVSEEDIAVEAGEAAPGRLHLARLLHKKGYVQSPEQAFGLYLGRGCPAYVPRVTLDCAGTMELLTGVGAIPVLAHPGREGKGLVEELIPLGLQGIEAYHPDHPPALAELYRNMALERDLLVTGGSDYHGGGAYPVNRAVARHYLEKMKSRV